MEPILFNTRNLRDTGLPAIGHNFGEVAIDDFFGRGVILVERQESGSTPMLIDGWNKSVQTTDRSLTSYFSGSLEKPLGSKNDFS